MPQSLRRSQYITTYGPGAVLEGPGGPRVIVTLDRSGLFSSRPPGDFEITDLRLSQALLNNASILRLPSNAESGRPDDAEIYSTDPFPSWSLCPRHNILYQKTTDDRRACPRCSLYRDNFEAWRQARRQAIRFVRACDAGHLDDVDWRRVVHTSGNCNPPYFQWQGGGGSLRNIDIVCPNCGARINLGTAYSRDWPCSGRLPERGNNRPGCNRPSKIIQRGAANLRIAELRTALTIPPRSTPIHRLLEMGIIRALLIDNPPRSKNELLDRLRRQVERNQLRPSVLVQIQNASEEEVLRAISDTIDDTHPATPLTLRLDEFEALCHAATYGAPPRQAGRPGTPPQFEVIQSQVRVIPGPHGTRLRVTPVNRLRVVMVQTGYRRLDPTNPPVDCVFDDGGLRSWYPGVELFGEGIFIDLAPETPESIARWHMPLSGKAAVSWYDAWVDPEGYEQHIDLDERDQLHPVFVWWHTLSHRLINALSLDSGYSSAAVRERVFANVNGTSGEASGGILLYTAQPGGDGTLGGLVALVPDFERVLRTAFRNLDVCSNDPLCGEESFAPGKYNGAACYACALVSETSCEHRNMRLDRNLLLDNLP